MQTGSEFLLATGGDDNSLNVEHVSLNASTEPHVVILNKANHPSAHATQITGKYFW